jgi:osmotically-inducible protein OsmY
MADNADPKQSNTVTHTADTRNPEWPNYAPEGHGRTDEQIRADVHQALLGLGTDSHSKLSISVEGGVITLGGQVASNDEQQKVIKLIRGVPSVKDVRDQLKVAS